MDIVFGAQSYQHRSLPVSAQRMVNCYGEASPNGGRSPMTVVPSFGIESFTTVGTGPNRGYIVANDVLHVVSGPKLYRIASNGTATELGSVPGAANVDMLTDGTNVLSIVGGNGYLWNGFTLTVIADADFPGAARGDYLDGYAVIIEPGSGRFWINETAGDWSTWNALDFATAEGWPDDTLDLIVDHRELFLFGRETIEAWYNAGGADFPLERVPSGFIERGILSSGAVTKSDNTVFFAGNDGVFYRLDGYTPSRISTHAVEQAIENYADKTCNAFSMFESGHTFVVFKFAEGAWCYDVATGLWHERQSYGSDTWRVLGVARAFGRLIAIDEGTNKLGTFSSSTFTEWGDPLRASGTSIAVAESNRWIFHSRLELVFEQGRQ